MSWGRAFTSLQRCSRSILQSQSTVMKIEADYWYYIDYKTKIHKTQQNSKYRLCDGRHKKITHIISECCKLALKEYQTSHNWVWKGIHWELCQKFKFDHTNKWFMTNPESVLINKTHKLLWDFEIQKNHLISARQPDLMIVTPPQKKTTCWMVNYWIKMKESKREIVKVIDATCLGIRSAHESVWLVERKSETDMAASSIFDDGRSRTSER